MELREVQLDFIDTSYSSRNWTVEISTSVPVPFDDMLVVHLRGNVFLDTVFWTAEMMNRLVDHGYKYLVIDYSGVEKSGSGTPSIFQVMKKARDAGGDAIITAPHPQVREVFELLNLTQWVVDSVDCAIQRLALRPPEDVDILGLRITYMALRMPRTVLLSSVSGNPGHHEYQILDHSIRTAIERGWNHIAVDAADLVYLGSVGIVTFVNLRKMTQERGGEMIMLNLRDELVEEIGELGFGEMLHVVPTRDDAMKIMMGT